MPENIRSGSPIFFKLNVLERDFTGTCPRNALVLGADKSFLVVAEPDSINGLAKIVPHARSKDRGCYWYQFIRWHPSRPNERESVEYELAFLLDDHGRYITTESFVS